MSSLPSVSLQPAGTGRRLLASNITVTLSITISPLVETPAQVETATRALYAAITNQPSASLPAGASLDTVLQLLNKNLLEGGADTLLADVQRAIVDSNLATVFNASLTNVTEIAGVVVRLSVVCKHYAPTYLLCASQYSVSHNSILHLVLLSSSIR